MAGLGLLAVSAILLVAGAELFTENAAGAARHLRLTLFGVAFLLAGAEPEELITAVVASGSCSGRDGMRRVLGTQPLTGHS